MSVKFYRRVLSSAGTRRICHEAYLSGTAAAEGWPAASAIRYAAARRLGGGNIRTRSQALVDDALLLDFLRRLAARALRQGWTSPPCAGCSSPILTPTTLPAELVNRGGCYSHGMKALRWISSATRPCGIIYKAAGHDVPTWSSACGFISCAL
ncbi:MAG: hypothetical protein ACLRZH_16695 [Ruthenibacterium lactatiformans]